MSEEIEIKIDTNKIPRSVGSIVSFNEKKSMNIESMSAFRVWVQQKIPFPKDNDLQRVFVVTGPMPNCAALQIGLILSGYGQVVFETTRQMRRKMGV